MKIKKIEIDCLHCEKKFEISSEDLFIKNMLNDDKFVEEFKKIRYAKIFKEEYKINEEFKKYFDLDLLRYSLKKGHIDLSNDFYIEYLSEDLIISIIRDDLELAKMIPKPLFTQKCLEEFFKKVPFTFDYIIRESWKFKSGQLENVDKSLLTFEEFKKLKDARYKPIFSVYCTKEFVDYALEYNPYDFRYFYDSIPINFRNKRFYDLVIKNELYLSFNGIPEEFLNREKLMEIINLMNDRIEELEDN